MADELPSTVMRTYKFRLLPRKGQHKRLREALEHTHALYNAALEERIDAYKKGGVSRSCFEQFNSLTELRSDKDFAKFGNSMQRWPIKRVDLAFRAFFRRLKGGDRPGFPRYKSFRGFTTFGFEGPDSWKMHEGRLYMQGIGRVRLHLHRAPPVGTPVACQVKLEGTIWVALLVFKVPVIPLEATGQSVGIDLGIVNFIATSSGAIIPGLRASKHGKAEMRRRRRALSRCRLNSIRRRKVRAELARAHRRIANARKTFHHQTAAKLIRNNDLLAVERLSIGGLARGFLSRDVHDAGWGSFITILTEKAEKAGRVIVKVDPKYTSQTCSGCGAIEPKKLSQRVHRCDCGTVLDRDHNAAINILNRAVTRPDLAKSLTKAA